MIEPKSRAGWRSVPMLAILRDYLDAHLRAAGRIGEDLVFGRTAAEAFYASTVDGRAKRAWKAANERERELAADENREPDLLRPISLHMCRHTFASLLIDSGANPKAIQEFMGHSKIHTTFDVYGHRHRSTKGRSKRQTRAPNEKPGNCASSNLKCAPTHMRTQADRPRRRRRPRTSPNPRRSSRARRQSATKKTRNSAGYSRHRRWRAISGFLPAPIRSRLRKPTRTDTSRSFTRQRLRAVWLAWAHSANRGRIRTCVFSAWLA